MADTVLIAIGTTLGTVLLLICIILTIVYCYTHFYYNRSISKQEQSLHSAMINKDFRSNSSISFINYDYHNNTTLLAPSRRLAILELQQEQTLNPSQTFAYENPSFHLNEIKHIRTMRF